jgi:uncharacterized membrane protein YhaH (DUF805 family)
MALSDYEHSTEDGAFVYHDHMNIYWRVIITLTVLTAVEFAISFGIDGKADSQATLFMFGVLGLIALAAWKAVLVGRFFMHLKYDPGILSFLAIIPVILATPLVLFCIYDGLNGPAFM